MTRVAPRSPRSRIGEGWRRRWKAGARKGTCAGGRRRRWKGGHRRREQAGSAGPVNAAAEKIEDTDNLQPEVEVQDQSTKPDKSGVKDPTVDRRPPPAATRAAPTSSTSAAARGRRRKRRRRKPRPRRPRPPCGGRRASSASTSARCKAPDRTDGFRSRTSRRTSSG